MRKRSTRESRARDFHAAAMLSGNSTLQDRNAPAMTGP